MSGRDAMENAIAIESPDPLSQQEAGVPRPWTSLSLPHELMRIPSMLTEEEKQYLVWLTACRYEGWGAVVDLGPWLGSSSAALAEGLKRRGGGKEKVVSIDLFEWCRSYMQSVASEDLQDGDDFLPAYLREIGDYSRWIEPQKHNLMTYRWMGGPIEILFVDAAKSWDLTNKILQEFSEYLVPNRSRIVLQDFKFPLCHWLPLIFDGRPDLWQEVENVGIGTTVTFTPLRPLKSDGGIRSSYSDDLFPIESAERILRDRMSREDPENRYRVLLSLYR